MLSCWSRGLAPALVLRTAGKERVLGGTWGWLGEVGPQDDGETLTGNGRKVIGTQERHFGRVYAIALVLE